MDTEECYFFDQLEVIRDRFKVVDKQKITQYFEKLLNVVQEDENQEIRDFYGQIKKLFDMLSNSGQDAPKKQTEV